MKLRSAIGAFALAAATFVGGAATLHAQEMWYYGDNLSDESGQIVLEDPSNPGGFIIASARDGANYVFRINASGAITQTRRFQVSSGTTYKETITDLRVDATGSYLIGVGATELLSQRLILGSWVSAGIPRGGYVFKMRLSDLWVEWCSEMMLEPEMPNCANNNQISFEPAAILDASSTDGKYYIYGTRHIRNAAYSGGGNCLNIVDEQDWSNMWIRENGTLYGSDDYIRGLTPASFQDGYRNRVEAAVLGFGNKVLAVGNRDDVEADVRIQGASILSYPSGSMLYANGSAKHFFSTDNNNNGQVYNTRDVITLCNAVETCYGVTVGGNTSNGKFTLAIHYANSNTSSGSTNNAVHQAWEFQMSGWSTEAYEVVLDGMDASSVRLVVMGTATSGSNTDIFLAKIRLNISGTVFTPTIDWVKRYGQTNVQEGFRLNPQSQLIKTSNGNYAFVAHSDRAFDSSEKDIMFVKVEAASGNAGSTCEVSTTLTAVERIASRGFSGYEINVPKPPVTGRSPGNKFGGPLGGRLCFSGRMAPQGLELGHTSSLYPNPATNSATLAYTQAAPGAEAQLMDIRGGVVRSYPLSADEGTLDMSLDGLPQGIYLVSYPTAEGGRQTLKLVIQ